MSEDCLFYEGTSTCLRDMCDICHGKVAALRAENARLREAEAALREIADDFKAFVEYRGKVVNEWGSYRRARAFLAGGETE